MAQHVRVAFCGDLVQQVEHQPAGGFVVVHRHRRIAQEIDELVYRQRAIHQVAMVGDLQDLVLVVVQVLIFHTADDLLDHVGHGNDTGSATVFVYHHGNFGVLGLQHLQQLRDGNALGHCLDGADAQVLHRRALGKKVGVLDVHEADDVVLVFAEHRIAGEFVLPHEIEVGGQIVVQVDGHHLGARRHDGLGVLVVQVEDVVQVLVLVLFDGSALGAFLKQKLDLFLGVGLGFIPGVVPGKTHNAIGGGVEQPHDWVGNAVERVERARRAQRIAFRFQDSHALRNELAGYHMQCGHNEVADCHRDNHHRRFRQAEEREYRVEQRGKRRLAQPAQRKRGKRDAQLAGGKVLVDVVGHLQGALGTLAAFVHQDLYLRFANAHQGKLGDNEKCVHQQEQNNQYQTQPNRHAA